MGEKCSDKFRLRIRLPRNSRDLLHSENLRHGTDGFTFPPKEGVLRIFSPLKIRRLRPGLNPRTWVPKASTLPLDHRSRIYIYIYIVQIYFNLQRLRRLVRRPHTADLRVRCQVSLSAICGGQSGTGTGFPPSTYGFRDTRRRSWLRHCATSLKVAGSIPEGVNGPGVDSASNRN